jgi:hypothetical protein
MSDEQAKPRVGPPDAPTEAERPPAAANPLEATPPTEAVTQILGPAARGDHDRTEPHPDLARGPAASGAAFELSERDRTAEQDALDVSGSRQRSISGLYQVPGYKLVRQLGEGTYGVVYLAQDELTGMRVAIKFYARGAGLQWQLMQAEVKQLAILHADPGIVQLRDVEPEATPPYYVMAYAEGGSLADRLRQGPLPVREAMPIFRRVAEALAYVHAKGVRHCDLKPGNVLLDARGRPLVADFGQAHLSDDASPALGTFFYMAPEQADLTHQVPDTRWDVYGLGALLYAMLTGGPPREDSTLRSRLADTNELAHRLERYRQSVLEASPPGKHRKVPGVDRALADIIDGCLEVDPAKRYRDAAAVLEALDRREQRRRRRPLLLFGLAAPVVLLLAAAGLGFWAANEALTESEQALVAQLQESDRMSAKLVANIIGEKLKAWAERVIPQEAGSAELRKQMARYAAAKTPADADRVQREIQTHLGKVHRTWDKVSNQTVHRWTVAAADGKMLATEPPDDKVVNLYYGWRDWFSGKGDDWDHKAIRRPPVAAPHVSQPFFSTAAGDGMTIAVTAPIRDEHKNVVGVLAAAINVAKLHSWLKDVDLERGCVVLLDRQGHCLLHERPLPTAILPKLGANPPTYRDQSATFRKLLVERPPDGGVNPDHRDPIDAKLYLASYAPCEYSGWGALVQHEREPALRPVADLRRHMVHSGVVALAFVGLLLGGLWAWLFLTLRSGERVAHG